MGVIFFFFKLKTFSHIIQIESDRKNNKAPLWLPSSNSDSAFFLMFFML